MKLIQGKILRMKTKTESLRRKLTDMIILKVLLVLEDLELVYPQIDTEYTFTYK